YRHTEPESRAMGGSWTRFLSEWVVPLTGRRRRTLTRQVDDLLARDSPSRDELDAFKSSLEVPQSLIDEFEAWRVTAAVPAEPLVSICIPTYNRGRMLAER